MKKRILSFVLSVSLMLSLLPISSLAAGSMPFTDVTEKDWFFDAVEYVYENGMMSGTGNNKFSPNTTTTRGMIVTILHRMEGTPSADGAAFSDVPEGQWYTAAVAWASANSIVNGYGNDKFGPNDTITREQMAAILYRYSQYKGYDTTASDNLSGFSDAAKVSSYAADAMGWAVGSGLISGFSGNTLMPRGSATRAQVATILMRFCKKIALPSGKTYTVTFDYNYDSKGTYTSVKVQEGKPVESPADPIRSGYSFGGWFTASSGGNKFDFDALITGDITLYAAWSPDTNSLGNSGIIKRDQYTVSFNSNGGNAIATQTVAYGETAKKPDDPIREGYTFIGWFDMSDAKSYDFSTQITRDLTLYAQWDKGFSNGDKIYMPSAENLSYDEIESVIYYNNILIVYTYSDLTTIQAQKLADKIDGIIVGDINGAVNLLQIRVDACNLSTLKYLADMLMTSDDVYYVSYDIPIELQGNDLNPWANDKEDPEIDRGNENNPDGTDWWAEAIGQYSAWECTANRYRTTVGIIDDGFYTAHEDLSEKISFLPASSENSVNDGHGTSIAGIIAAENNTVGIRGIADESTLLCADKTPDGSVITTAEFVEITKQLIEGGANVINNSFGSTIYSEERFIAEKTESTLPFAEYFSSYKQYIKKCEKEAKKTAELCIAMMVGLLENEYTDFLIVQSAGNGYNNGEGNSVDAKLNCYYASIDRETFLNTNIKGNYTYQDIKNRILIVGAVINETDQLGNYMMADITNTNGMYSSNSGNTVDICAPGHMIYTTTYSPFDSELLYTYVDGTSMAAPMVAGAAALIWSIVPDLTAPEVRELLLKNYSVKAIGTGSSQGSIYPMLNTSRAVNAALNNLGHVSGKTIEQSTQNAVSAKIEVYSSGQPVQTIASNENDGTFDIYLPAGTYDLVISSEGYTIDGFDTLTITVTLNKGEHFAITDSFEFVKKESIEPDLHLEISGTVKDARTGKLLTDVCIYVYDENGYGPLLTSKTDNSGAFSISLEKNGIYSLRFIKNGYKSEDLSNIEITDSTNSVSINLTANDIENDFLVNIGDPDSDAVVITTAEELSMIKSGNYVLGADIDLSQYNGGEWIPIDPSGDIILDGQGHIISNLYCSSEFYNGGLFGKVSSCSMTIKNLGLIQINLNAYSYNGGLIAQYFNFGTKGAAEGENEEHETLTISNCFVNGNSQGAWAGGLLVGEVCNYTGKNSFGNAECKAYTTVEIKDCYAKGTVIGDGGWSGGFIGSCESSSGSNGSNWGELIITIADSISYADISDNIGGGFIGYLNYYNAARKITFSNCKSNTTVSGKIIGGMVGRALSFPIVFENCVVDSGLFSNDEGSYIAAFLGRGENTYSSTWSFLTFLNESYYSGNYPIANILTTSGVISTAYIVNPENAINIS